MSMETLAEQIERAFAGVPYPGDDRICEGVTDAARLYGSEEARIEAVFRGRHWRDMPHEDLARYSATFSFLTPEAYRFYLPAYWLAIIRLSPEERERAPGVGNMEQSLLFSLRPATDDPVLWDFRHRRIGPLTADQKLAVRAFLHWKYREWQREGVELFNDEKSMLGYWGYPAEHQHSSAEEPNDPLPPVIDGARLSGDGEWVNDGPNCLLINRLIWDRLIHVDQREGGWPKLYHDPTDGSYWELAYPHTEMWRGGAPVLTRLPAEQVRALYDLPALSLPSPSFSAPEP